MQRWMLVVALCGCDAVFGVDPPAVDAPLPDAPVPVLSRWTATTPLPSPRDYNHQHGAFVGDTLYMIGGFGETGESDVVHRATSSNGVLGEWTTTTPLPAPRALGDVVTIGSRIYVVGGAIGAVSQSSVYVAEPDTTGHIPSWSAVASLPAPRKAHGAAAANNFLYSFGGGDELNVRQTTVVYARVRADGNLDPWQPTTSLPGPRANFGGVAARGFLYAIGGDERIDPSALDSVLVAPLDPDDGHVGDWSATTPLPSARQGMVALTDGFHIYVIGGASNVATSEVIYSRISDDGALGPWQSSGPLLFPRFRHSGVLANGHLFVMGGAFAETSVEHATQGAP